jgi:hypothetical protein
MIGKADVRSAEAMWLLVPQHRDAPELIQKDFGPEARRIAEAIEADPLLLRGLYKFLVAADPHRPSERQEAEDPRPEPAARLVRADLPVEGLVPPVYGAVVRCRESHPGWMRWRIAYAQHDERKTAQLRGI